MNGGNGKDTNVSDSLHYLETKVQITKYVLQNYYNLLLKVQYVRIGYVFNIRCQQMGSAYHQSELQLTVLCSMTIVTVSQLAHLAVQLARLLG